MKPLHSCSSWLFYLFIICLIYAVSCVFEEEPVVEPYYDFDDYRVIDFKSPLVLSANMTKGNMNNYKVSWVKEGKFLNLSSDSRLEVPFPTVLKINKPKVSDAGNFSCEFFGLVGDHDISVFFYVVFKPIVKLSQHPNIISGESITLTCKIFSYPTADIYWKIGSNTYRESDERVNISINGEKNESVLQIWETFTSDRNTYTCGASNIVNTKLNSLSEASIFIRVKDRFAALWPFLGICTEVIILIMIMLIYQNKKQKIELDDSDPSDSQVQKNTQDHPKVRKIRLRK